VLAQAYLVYRYVVKSGTVLAETIIHSGGGFETDHLIEMLTESGGKQTYVGTNVQHQRSGVTVLQCEIQTRLLITVFGVPV
jgi:hypothetical protein